MTLLGITAATLIVAAMLLMRRWSGPAPGTAAARAADPMPAAGDLDPALAAELDRIESGAAEVREPALR